MSSTATQAPLAARLRSERVRDLAITVVALIGSLLLLAHGGLAALRTGFDPDAGRSSSDIDATSVVLVAASTLPLVVWRRHTAGVLVVTVAASTLLVGLGYPFDLALGPPAALYLLAASRKPRNPWARSTTVLVVGLLAAYLVAVAVDRDDLPTSVALHTGLLWAVAWFAGDRTRLRRKYIAELRERARRTEREAEQERLLAAAQERARIARDLHDSAGHAISVIAVRAGAARLRYPQDPEHALPALEAIETLARQTAEEIDHIVGTLRDGGPAHGVVEAPVGLASLDTLVSQHAAAGLQVDLQTFGTRPAVGGTTDQAAYRILQEALTNAARHGSGQARVELDFGATTIEITVTNPVPADAPPRNGGGHGLVGMHERATLLGGTLDTERTNGTFRLHASVPYGGQRS